MSRAGKAMLLILLIQCGMVAAVYLFYRIKVGLAYNWKWQVVPQFLFRYDEVLERWVPAILMQGFLTTLRLSIWATILSTIIGTVLGVVVGMATFIRTALRETKKSGREASKIAAHLAQPDHPAPSDPPTVAEDDE